MKTRGYIFDYGGTLDTGGCHWGKVFWHAYGQAGVPVAEEQFRDAYVYAERMLACNPIIQPEFSFRQTLEAKLRLQFDWLEENAGVRGTWAGVLLDRLYAGVLSHTAHSREVLRQLPQPKVLVTNFYGNMAVVLREFRLDGFFRHVVESAVVGVRKPDPHIFVMGTETLGLRPDEATVVGDSIEKDILPARKAGCHTVWLRGEQWADGPADTGAADLVIDDLTELITTSKY